MYVSDKGISTNLINLTLFKYSFFVIFLSHLHSPFTNKDDILAELNLSNLYELDIVEIYIILLSICLMVGKCCLVRLCEYCSIRTYIFGVRISTSLK